ncbi:MAG: M23 family metallopeptidase [Betaproteobacteria bacterium]
MNLSRFQTVALSLAAHVALPAVALLLLPARGAPSLVALLAGLLGAPFACSLPCVSRAAKRPAWALELAFPFEQGRYLVTDGGDGRVSSLVNYHFQAGVHQGAQVSRSMRYATDIAKLNAFDFTCRAVLIPRRNEQFEVYHAKVCSPCAVEVFAVTDGLDDNLPFSRKYPYNAGNSVVLRAGDVYVVLGHLAKGSIVVNVGDKVETGQHLAEIGNRTVLPRQEPRLHRTLRSRGGINGSRTCRWNSTRIIVAGRRSVW